MNTKKTYHFSRLKEQIATTFLASHAASSDIRAWKGDTITDFQEDLRSKTKGSISEKWFYTYMKNDTEKLPRIDMLNLLSTYVGFENWNDFVAKSEIEVEAELEVEPKTSSRKFSKLFWLVLLLPLLAFAIYSMYPTENTFTFCFTDADQREAITKIPLDIEVIRTNESSLYFKSDSLGCFSYTTSEKELKFVVKSPYHKTDTIVRHINSSSHKTVQLQTDDYALMLLYYANGNKEDWQKRRVQLDELIADNAQIYRVFPNTIGIEMYSKKEFINLLTIPTSSLKKMQILDKIYANEQIVKLKFTIQ
ncbi:hypothetical protein C8N46_10550 [Kordia periserrulae]|uniref:Uncharacterized protein n=1 Tax=Kordia periserrulae TaxID=701523 RepID=A0A2T6BXT3_9FLAO|nr:hypothetical protein [Kordia periserrulae]PTX60894.1 hypothetical protein C8N46_10550 [Kordia periserrulae]